MKKDRVLVVDPGPGIGVALVDALLSERVRRRGAEIELKLPATPGPEDVWLARRSRVRDWEQRDRKRRK